MGSNPGLIFCQALISEGDSTICLRAQCCISSRGSAENMFLIYIEIELFRQILNL